jgi:carboxymethylenebutenolidase
VTPEESRRGGLVLMRDIFVVTEHVKEQCDLSASEGYEVLAPSLYDREAPGGTWLYVEIDQLCRVCTPFPTRSPSSTLIIV